MLWLVRSNPNGINRMVDFLNQNIIAVHWGIGDLTGCATKEDVAKVVKHANLLPRDASLKTGLLNRFKNKMKIDDFCIIPYNDVFYCCKIKSDYYYDPLSKGFEHQRKVEWLFDGEPFDRQELPDVLQASLKTQLGLADISQHEFIFKRYLNKKMGINEPSNDEENQHISLEIELNDLLNDAMEIIKDELNSDDPDRRLKAAIAIMELNNK